MIKLLPALNLKNVKVKENITYRRQSKNLFVWKVPGIAALCVYFMLLLFFLGRTGNNVSKCSQIQWHATLKCFKTHTFLDCTLYVYFLFFVKVIFGHVELLKQGKKKKSSLSSSSSTTSSTSNNSQWCRISKKTTKKNKRGILAQKRRAMAQNTGHF